MKTITFKITHDEVFNDLIKEVIQDDGKERKSLSLDKSDPDNIVINLTGTLKELENEE